MRYSRFYQVQFGLLDETVLIVCIVARAFSPESGVPGSRFTLKSTVTAAVSQAVGGMSLHL
jgi:hypothetical protein